MYSQAGVLLLTFNAVVAPGQRIVKVVGDVFVELFVLFIGDFRLVTSPQRLALLIFSQEITVSPSFSSRFSISTGSAIWSEYLLMMERTRQSSRNSSSPSRRCRVISVPRSSLVMSATVYSPSPADSQKTPFSGFSPGRASTHGHFVSHDKRRVETNTKLTDQLAVFRLVRTQGFEE